MRTFVEFESRPSLKMWLIHRFYDDTNPYDDDPNGETGAVDGKEEGNSGIWGHTWQDGDPGSIGGTVNPALETVFCKLNELQGDPDAPYSDIRGQCPARRPGD